MIQPGQLVAEQIYAVNHSRKGRFTARIDAVLGADTDDCWIDMTIVTGVARNLARWDYTPGDKLRVRASLCTFSEVEA